MLQMQPNTAAPKTRVVGQNRKQGAKSKIEKGWINETGRTGAEKAKKVPKKGNGANKIEKVAYGVTA